MSCFASLDCVSVKRRAVETWSRARVAKNSQFFYRTLILWARTARRRACAKRFVRARSWGGRDGVVIVAVWCVVGIEKFFITPRVSVGVASASGDHADAARNLKQ